MRKCGALWKKCKWPKSSEIITSILGSALLVPVVTRWNSLYDAILKLLQHKEKLNELCDKFTLSSFTLSDIKFLESYQLLMEPIASTLDFLQGEDNVKYGCLLPSLLSLSNKLRKVGKKTNLMSGMSSFADKLEHQLRERFQSYFTLSSEADMALAAAVLTPEVKFSWLKVIQHSCPGVTEEHISKRVIETICDFLQKNNRTFYSMPPKPVNPCRSTFYDFSLNDDEDDVCTPYTPTSLFNMDLASRVTHEFHSYVSDTAIGTELWSRYTVLKEAYVAFNTPLTSSAPVERLFSFAGIINTPRRNSLADFSFEKLVLMKANASI